MKKLFYLVLVILLFVPGHVLGLYLNNKSSAISNSDKLIYGLTDYNKYLVTDSSINHVYKDGSLSYDSNYHISGFLNKYEYNAIGGKTSYLFDGNEYWMLTEYDSNNSYVVSSENYEYLNNLKETGVRSTVYIKNGITFTGIGTYDNPWMFVGISKYTLNINLGTVGGYFVEDFDTTQMLAESDSLALPEVLSEDYNFTGWTVTSGSGRINNKIVTMGDSDMEVTANWTKKTYTLTLELGSMAEFATTTSLQYTLSNGDPVTISSNPIKKGYRFTGWTVTTGDGTVSGSTITMGRQNTTVTANWSVASYDFANAGMNNFTIPYTGYYQLEVWGAQGGMAGFTSQYGYTMWGGFGGYSTGATYLTAGTRLYIAVGGVGNWAWGGMAFPYGGYNGGGNSIVPPGDGINGAGGGATHIATSSGTLNNFSSNYSTYVLIAAGGGGGIHSHTNAHNSGGSGGGYSGSNNSSFPWGAGRYNGRDWNCTYPTGGNQSSAGIGYNYCGANGKFGIGGSNTYQVNNFGGAGGGGLFGGGAGGHGDTCSNSGAGGSGYIANSSLVSKNTSTVYNKVTKVMYCYLCSSNSSANTYTISVSNVSDIATSGYAKMNDGYARIIYLSEN